MTMIRTWIEAAAVRRGDAAYLEDAAGDGTLTYGGLARAAQVWERELDRNGVPPGGRVAVRAPDPLGYATALVGILAAGRVAVPLDPAAPAPELARVLTVARPAAVACDAAARLTVLGPSFWDDGPNGPDATPADTGIFLSTSGTTGTPKGILLREEQLCHVAAAVADHHRLTPAERGYCCLPLFHVNAEVVGLLATLAAQACLVLDRKFSRRGFWELIGERRITWINAVPAIITVLTMDPPAVRPAGVRFVRSASAPLPPSVLRRFEETFGIPVVETYGMTEAASMITANPLDGPRKPGSAGRAAGTEVRVVASAGAVGRVQIRGRGVLREYASGGSAVDAEGWLDTGDLGHLDRDGYLFLAGRSDDVINRGGEKIYPREIEDFLLAQPGVWSAAVTGTRDEVLGERPVAYVVPDGALSAGALSAGALSAGALSAGALSAGALSAGAFGLAEALREACEAALPRAKRPSAFYLVKELPVGPTGKVSRKRLAELAPVSGL
jgi:oxalate---CoA ligase